MLGQWTQAIWILWLKLNKPHWKLVVLWMLSSISIPSLLQENVRSFPFILLLVAGYKLVNNSYSLWKKKACTVPFSNIQFYLCLPFFASTSLPRSLSVYLPSFLQLLADRQRPAFIYACGFSDEPRGVTMFVVKCYKSDWLRGTRGEQTRSRPWRPSADKALLI